MLLYNEQIFKRCFSWQKKYWYKNIKYIPLYFKLIHYLIKHGYDEYATWEPFGWFIDTMRPILKEFRSINDSHPYRISEEEWHATLDRMIELLDIMDECNPKYDTKEYCLNYTKQQQEMYAAKDEFFKLFAEYFYDLWD